MSLSWIARTNRHVAFGMGIHYCGSATGAAGGRDRRALPGGARPPLHPGDVRPWKHDAAGRTKIVEGALRSLLIRPISSAAMPVPGASYVCAY